MATPKDRLAALLVSTTYNGVDFVAVDDIDPRVLYVHFLNAVAVAAPSITATITGGDSIPSVPVAPIKAADWGADADGRPLLTLHALSDGDFSTYVLTLAGAPALDLIYSTSEFSFKANCPSDFDCAPPPLICPADDTPAPPIDYLAKDFTSFRNALIAYSSLRFPQWVERSEADFGMMFLEALSGLADDLSYYQDRVAAEATLPTATQRRSLVSLARLVDYEPRPAISATTQLVLDVPKAGLIAPGARVFAATPDGGRIPFEVGTGLTDPNTYPVSDLWNFGIAPYWFDDSEQCWPAGSTGMWLAGVGYGFTTGQTLLIQTDLPGESLRQVVHLVAPGAETTDPLFGNAPVTHVIWRADEALRRAIDLTRTRVGANVVPATQGARVTETFAIGEAPVGSPGVPVAIARRGPNGDDENPNWVFRYPLGQPPLAWLAVDGSNAPPSPQIVVSQTQPTPANWTFVRNLLQAEPTAPSYTVDAVSWRAISITPEGLPIQSDIDGGLGDTIRFGDGVFGASPADGDLFQALYRVGAGAAGNVAQDTITQVDPAYAGVITAARNPFPVTNASDPETTDHIRRMAPQAFRALQFRAVTPADYEAAAESLTWVQKAGASFRWTGSWATVFTAADPRGSEAISLDREIELVELLNRRRLAGYESYAPTPIYLSVDLRIEVCVEPGWLDGDVEAAVLDRLGSATRPDDATGFFFADRFTFGSPLYRSRLESAIQGVPGVAGVRAITYRQRGSFPDFEDLPPVLTPGPHQILRVDNDPSWPERGVIRVIPEGGR